MTDYAALRRNMVDCQLRTYDVTNREVLAAMDAVPRELFVPDARKPLAYIDQPVPLDGLGAPSRALLPPMTAGRMLQTLELKAGQRFLDYEGGTGYVAALAAAMGAAAVLRESHEELRAIAGTALAATGQGGVTVAPQATGVFDAIFVNGACEGPPRSLHGLLADGGRMVAIEGVGRAGRVMLYQRSHDVVSGRPVFDAAGPLLAEFRQERAFAL
jgi:protein-L-isoaspartate(D-aspartate) O-methyltransferase